MPGTIIEAYGDNGSYYVIHSDQNGTARHPFNLDLPAGIGFRLVMITNEGTKEEVITPLGFRDSSSKVRTRFVLGKNDSIDLGYVPLPTSRNEAADRDHDGDGVMVLDDVGAGNPLVSVMPMVIRLRIGMMMITVVITIHTAQLIRRIMTMMAYQIATIVTIGRVVPMATGCQTMWMLTRKTRKTRKIMVMMVFVLTMTKMVILMTMAG